MIVPFVLIGVFLILWSVYDIFKQSIDWKYKIMMTLVVCLFSIVGILVYWLLLRPRRNFGLLVVVTSCNKKEDV